MESRLYKTATALMAVFVILMLSLGAEAFAYQVKGTIYGGSTPLPSAKVRLVNAATFANFSSTTSSSGGYGISVANGTYNLSVTPPTANGFNQSVVNGIVVNGADVTQNVVLMQQAITVSGTLKSSDGTIVQNADIYFYYSGTYTTAKQLSTGTTGTYSASLSPGSYDVKVCATKGSANHVPELAIFYFNNIPFTADTTKDFSLGIAKVTGKTTDSNGVPVAGVSLDVRSSTSNSPFETATSDNDGNYTLYVPSSTNYSVSATPPSGNILLAPTIFKGLSFTSDTTKDFALRSAITVTGTLKCSDGTIVQNAYIYFKYAGTYTTAKELFTGTTGTYSASLSPGSYEVVVEASKGSANHVPANAYFYFNNISLTTGTTKNFTLNIVKVTGKTTDSNGVSVSGVSLDVGNTAASPSFTLLTSETATSDSNGNYTLYLPSYTDYSVSLTPTSGNILLAPTIFHGLSFTANTTRDFALQSAVTVTGTLKSSDGTIVQNADIYFYYAGTHTTAKQLSTGTTGTYSASLSPGSYDVEVYASKGSVNHVPEIAIFIFNNISLTADTTKDFNLDIVKVTGKTTDSNGVPVSGVFLVLDTGPFYSQGGSDTATSDSNGNYTLYAFPYNELSINITPPTGSGFASQFLNGLSITQDLLQNVILDLPDTKPPVIISGPSVSGITNSSASVEWQTNEPTRATLKYGTSNPPSTGVTIATAKASQSQTLSGLLADTTYYVSVAVTDTWGNGPIDSPVVSFHTSQLADTTPPVILEGPIVTAITPNSAAVEWTTDEPSTGTLYYSLTSPPGTAKSDTVQTTTHRLTLTGLSADTLYFVKVTAKDLIGNGPTTSAIISFRTMTAIDNTPPLIVEGPMATDISDSGAAILWKTDEPATSGVSYNDGTAYGVVSDDGLVTEHSVRLTGLKPSTTHTYSVSSKDAFGNGPTLSQPATFKTLVPPDTTPPVTIERAVVLYTTHQSAVIFWRTDEPSDSLVEFGTIDTLGKSEGKAALVTQHTITLTGLEQGTLYYFRVSSKDAFGNGPTVSSIITFTTDTLARAKSLTITKGPDLVFLSDNLATISWETDVLSDSVIEYATAAAPGTLRVSEAKRGKTHQLTIGNLTQGTPYTATVISSGVDGASAKAPVSFTTLNSPDTDAPQIVDGPTAIGITDSKAIIKWRTDRAADSRVYFGIQGQAMDNVQGETTCLKDHVVVLTNLRPATTYSYYVISHDPKGNGPATSSVWTFTTKGAADTTGPTMTTPTVSGITDSQAVINWTTGEPATTQVAYGLAADLRDTPTATPGLNEAHSITLTNLAAATTYYVKAISSDTSGNPSESAVIFFTTGATLRYWKVTPGAATNGSISPSTAQTVMETGTTSFAVTPATGFMIGSVSGCNGTLSGDTFTTGPVTADCTVTASFISDKPTVTVATTPSSPQPVGSAVTLTATGHSGKGSYEYAFQFMEAAVWTTVQEYSNLSTWTWDTSGKKAAAYNFKVLIRNAGSTATSEGSAALVYELTSLPKPALTLSTSPASPQTAGTQVTFTATGSGGTGTYEYAFQILQAGVWTTLRAYDSAATWTWDTTGSPLATYSVRALIRNAGSTADYEAAASASYILAAPPKPTVQLAVSPTSPQVTGTPVTFTATGSGGTGTYEYAFQIFENSVWQTVQGYSGSNTWAWNTTGKAPTTYTVKALIRNAGSTAASEGTAWVNYIISAPPKPTVQLSTNLPTPQMAGTQVTFTANGSGGSGTYEYAFQIFDGAWKTAQAYGSTNTWIWDTTGKVATSYPVNVLIRNAGSTAASEGTASLNFVLTAPPSPSIKLAVTPASPQMPGAQVTFTATGSGGSGSYEYAFQILEGGVWKTMQDYSSSNAWVWDTTGKIYTSYSIKALIRNAGSTAASQATTTVSYLLTSPPKPTVTLTVSPASPQVSGAQVTLTGTGKGGTGSYEYSFEILEGGVWTSYQGYSSVTTWTWNTTGKVPGSYSIRVAIRNAGSGVAAEGTDSMSYVISPPPKPTVTLSASSVSPQRIGAKVTLTATGKGGTGNLEYCFKMFIAGAWTVVQPYGSSNTWIWDSAGNPATTHSFMVLVRNVGSTAASEGYVGLNFILSP